jgi:CubicO group peptidase (beta-lactamase class C family)
MTIQFKKRVLVAIVSSFMALTNVTLAADLQIVKPEVVGLSSARLKNIKTLLQAEVDKGNIPGAVVMIERKGKLVYSEAVGYQDKAANVPMRLDTIFRIYSMTKPLVSVAAMMLVEDGKMELTDPISKFMPEFSRMQVSVVGKDVNGNTTYSLEPATKSITVQDLLRHTSGIVYPEITANPVIKQHYIDTGLYVPGGTDYDQRRVTPRDMIAAIASAPLSTQPGTNWEYSMSVDLLGRVVEIVSGQRLSDFLQARLFQPLKMKDAGFYVPKEKQSRLAEALAVDPFTKNPIKLLDVRMFPNNDSGGAGGVATAADYLNFAQMMLQGGEFGGQHLLSPMTVNLMTSDMLGNRTTIPMSPGQLLMGVDGYTFGLGFMVRLGQGLAGVDGSAGEYMWAGAAGTFFWIDPKEQMAVVFMSQVPGPIRPYYRKLVKQAVSAAVIGK